MNPQPDRGRAPAITAELAEFALAEHRLPEPVLDAGTRALLNMVGCALGGVDHPATEILLALARELGGSASATVIGRGRLVDTLSGAQINALAASAHAFDDTHLTTVVHPTAPIAAALLALAERAPLSGRALLDALCLGIEIECRLALALLLEPAQGQWGWYITGVTGGIAAAAAGARVLGLSAEQTRWAMGLAANQASGFRQTHGTMCTGFVPAHAARCGLQAVLLAARGFTASDAALEGVNGFCDVFSLKANPAAATEDLGERWEILANAFKPYPCGIVIHPVLDACLEIAAQRTLSPDSIAEVALAVDPLCLTLCDRPAPQDSQLAQVSVQHWAAAALVRGRAGLPEGADECVRDPRVIAVRDKVRARPDSSVGRDGARVAVVLRDGTRMERTVAHCRGSAQRPMSSADLEAKFAAQASDELGGRAAADLIRLCWSVRDLDDVAELLRGTVAR